MRYVMQGVMIATAVVMMLNAVKYFGNKPLQVTTTSTETKKQDTAFTITNFNGRALFNKKCSACHSLFGRADPDLIRGFEERIPDDKLLHDWIQSSSKVIKSGNPYFNAMYKEFNVLMPDFPELTDEQIDDIIEYMKQVERMRNHR